MQIVRSMTKTPAILVALLVLVCAGMATLGMVWWFTPKVRAVAQVAVAQYDVYLPEISIERGQASINKPQPYVLDFGQGKEAAFVIDTRAGHENDALDYLKQAQAGAVLTRESLVTKNQGQIRIIPLNTMPDMVLNSHSIKSIVEHYLPGLLAVAAALVALYFLVAKPLQVLILALIPYVWARSASAELTFGGAFKIAAFCMVPSVLFTLFQDLAGVRVPGRFFIYFGLFLVLTVISSLLYVRSGRKPEDSSDAINP